MSLNDTITSLGTSIINLVNKKVADAKIVVNVKDFGAKGDGETDDTEAIQAALDAANPFSEVVFDGLFKISDELIINKPLIIRGMGGKTIGNLVYQRVTQGIIQTAQKNAFTIYPALERTDNKLDWAYYPNDSFGVGNIEFRDLYIRGVDRVAGYGAGIALAENENKASWYFVNVRFSNVQIHYFEYGIKLTDWTVYDIDFENCGISACLTGVIIGAYGWLSDVGANKIHFTNCDIYSCDIGIDGYTKVIRDFCTTRCNFAYNRLGIYARSNYTFVDFYSEFEDNTESGIEIYNGTWHQHGDKTLIGTKFSGTRGNYTIHMAPYQSNTLIMMPLYLIGCIINGKPVDVATANIHVMSQFPVLSGGSEYAQANCINNLMRLRVNRYGLLSRGNLPKIAHVCGTGTGNNVYKTLILTAGSTLRIWANCRTSTIDGTTVESCVNRIYNATDNNTLLYDGWGTGDSWNTNYSSISNPIFSYKNETDSDIVIAFKAGGGHTSSIYHALFLYTVS